MTPAAKIASDTWRRLSRAHHLGARLGEETLTDLLILEMLHFQKSNAFAARNWKLWAASLSSFVTVNPSSLAPPGALYGIDFQESG